MLPTRPLLLLAALCALAVPTAAQAASWTVDPIVTGGKVTFSGGASGTLKSSSPGTDEYYNETATVDWSAASYVADLYGGVSVFDDGGASSEVKDYTAIPGGGTVSARFRNWDPVKGYTWKNVTCKNGGRAITAPQPGRALGGKLTPPSVGFIDFATDSTCDNANNTGRTGNTIGSTIMGAVSAAQVAVGGTPPAGAAKDFPVSFSDDAACPPNGLQNCRYSYAGQGTVHVECAVCLTSVTLAQHDHASGQLEDVPLAGTTDGNRVFVTATFTNKTPYTIKSIVNWRERVSKRKLIDAGGAGNFETFPANTTKKVVFEWDTSGFAWEKGKPSSDRELEVRTGMGGGYVKVKVLPRPVVAVHGWWATAKGWDTAKQLIPATIHPLLEDRVYAVGDGQGFGIMDTDPQTGVSIATNAGREAQYIESIRQKTDAEHVDLIGHSMGGLISRYYIQKLMPESRDGWPVVSHLVMLGTPNMGSPCANVIGLTWKGIPTDQLKPEFVEGVFNKEILQRRGVPFSLMAGDIEERTCTSPRHGDLVVEVESAYWTLEDVAKTYAHHVELTDLDFVYGGFVKTRLGVDPDQAQNPFQEGAGSAALRAAAAAAARADARVARRDLSAAARSAAQAAAVQAGVARTVTVPAGGTVDVPIPVAAVTALSVGTAAPGGVTSSLIAPGGTVTSTIAAGTVEAREPMRFQRAESPASGTWTLRLTQPGGDGPVAVAVVGALEGSPLVLKASLSGDVVTATLRDGGAGVAGATVAAELRAEGQAPRTVTLRADGAGTYAATVADLPAGAWTGTVHAVSGAGERFAEVTAADGGTSEQPAPGGDGGDADPTPGGGAPAPAPGGGGSAPAAPVRAGAAPAPARGASTPAAAPATVSLTLAAKSTRVRRAPFAFLLRGTLAPAKGAACPAGAKVLVAITAGKRTVGRATVTVGASCAFTAKVKVTRRGKLRATARTIASASLAAAVSRPLALRAG